METKNVLIRVPSPTHKLARMKSLRVGKSLNKVLNAKLMEWLNEPETETADEQPRPTGKRKPVAA